jgi:hypothetical protein
MPGFLLPGRDRISAFFKKHYLYKSTFSIKEILVNIKICALHSFYITHRKLKGCHYVRQLMFPCGAFSKGLPPLIPGKVSFYYFTACGGVSGCS